MGVSPEYVLAIAVPLIGALTAAYIKISRDRRTAVKEKVARHDETCVLLAQQIELLKAQNALLVRVVNVVEHVDAVTARTLTEVKHRRRIGESET